MGSVTKKYYVAGFAFSRYSTSVVALVKKNRPAWQRGLYNAIGGKVGDIVPGETSIQAMVREFQEETGLTTEETDWKSVATLEDQANSFQVRFFAASLNIANLVSTTDEKIEIVRVGQINRHNSIPNLEYLVPLAKLVLTTDHPEVFITEGSKA